MQNDPEPLLSRRRARARYAILSALALYWIPVIACMALIFVLSSGPSLWDVGPVHLQDKLGHVAAYAVLGMLLARAFGGYARFGVASALVCAFLGATAYGLLNELCQLFLAYRHATVQDALANAIGAALGGTVAIGASQLWSAWQRRTSLRVRHGDSRGRLTAARRRSLGRSVGGRAGARRPERR
jgi:hypothetical protein